MAEIAATPQVSTARRRKQYYYTSHFPVQKTPILRSFNCFFKHGGAASYAKFHNSRPLRGPPPSPRFQRLLPWICKSYETQHGFELNMGLSVRMTRCTLLRHVSVYWQQLAIVSAFRVGDPEGWLGTNGSIVIKGPMSIQVLPEKEREIQHFMSRRSAAIAASLNRFLGPCIDEHTWASADQHHAAQTHINSWFMVFLLHTKCKQVKAVESIARLGLNLGR